MGNHWVTTGFPWLPAWLSRGCGPNVGVCSSIFDDASSHQYGWRGQGLCPGWHGGHGGHGWLGYWWLLAMGHQATSRGINVAVRHRFWRTSIMGWVIVPRISRFDHGTYVNVYTRISYILYHICTYVYIYIYATIYSSFVDWHWSNQDEALQSCQLSVFACTKLPVQSKRGNSATAAYH